MAIQVNQNEIGKRIKMAREAQQMSQAKLGKLIRVDQSTIALWELGRTTPRLNVLVKLSAQLFVCPSYILFGENNIKDMNTQSVPRSVPNICVGCGCPG